MSRRQPPTRDAARSAARFLPQWELDRPHRRRLDRRVRAVRRSLVAGGLAGTVAFSALAAHETRTQADDPAPDGTSTAASLQASGAEFFAGQANAELASATATATATPSPTPTAPAAAPLLTIDTPTPEPTVTPTPEPTMTPTPEPPVFEQPPLQTRSQTNASH
jgi:outer membrane biosynthesis protein TonB